MKLNYPNYLLLSSVTLSLGLGALFAQAQQTQEAEALFVLPSEDAEADLESQPVGEAKEDEIFTVVPQFTVSTEKDDGYYSAHTLGGTRTSALIKDTPMTIGVVNAELLNDLGLTQINDLAQVLAGVEAELDSGFNDRVVKFRGLNTRNQLFEFLPRGIDQDGYNIERAEVIRGANSLIYGQADPGGKINYLGKRAQFNKNETTIKNKFGSNDLIRWELDSNYVVNDKFAVRVLGAYQKAGAHLDNKEKLFQGATIEATYRLSEKTEFRLHAEQIRGKRSGGSYSILEDNTTARGLTGAITGMPLSADFYDFLPDAAKQQMINFNQGGTIYDSDGNPRGGNTAVHDFFTNEQDIKDYYKRISLDRDELGEWRGDDIFREIKGYYFIGEMIHSFTDDLSLKLVLGNEKSSTSARNLAGNNVVLSTRNPFFGNGNVRDDVDLRYYNLADPIAGASLTPDWDARPSSDTFDDSYSVRSTLSWHKELWGTKQQFIFSYDFDLKDIGSFREDFLVNGAAVNADTGYFNNNQLFRDLYTFGQGQAPLSFDPANGQYYDGFNQESTINTHAGWFANQGNYFGGRLHTLVGLRFDRIGVESTTDDIRSNNNESGNNAALLASTTKRPPNQTEDVFTKWSPTIGFLVAITDNVGFFANFSKSIQSPNGFDTDPFGNILLPETGEGFEGGFKFEALNGKLNGQLVGYSITKENAIVRFSSAEAQLIYPRLDGMGNPIAANSVLYDSNDSYDPIGQNRTSGTVVEVQGIEFSANYNPTHELSLIFQYAYTDAVIQEHEFERFEGDQENGYSPHSATFSARYSFKDGRMKGTFMGTSMKYKSPALFSTIVLDNGEKLEIELDDSFTTNVFIGWRGKAWWAKNQKKAPQLSIQFNVSNLFDEQSLQARGSGNGIYGAPRSYSVQSSIKF